jgi:GH18 family chitinase
MKKARFVHVLLKTFFFFYVFVIYLAISAVPVAAKPPYIVAPYALVGGSVAVSGIPWSDITHLNEAFGSVNSSSPFASFTQPGAWSTLVSTAHTSPNNTRVCLSFGGAGVSDATWATATNSTNLSTFVTEIMNIVSTNDFDGVDIDWEFPTTTDKAQFMSLMSSLASNLHALSAYDGNPKSLTFYISPGSQICGVDWTTIGNYADYGVQGGYDYNVSAGGTVYNGPVSLPNTAGVSFTDCFGTQRPLDSSANIADIVSRGFSWNKVILGCPFYIENGGNSNVGTVIGGGTFVTSAIGTLEMESVYTYGGSNYGVNDRDAFCAKINWALSKGMPGISMWDMDDAYPTTGTSVAAIWNVIGGNDSCLNLATATSTMTETATRTSTSTATTTSTATRTSTSTSTVAMTNTMTPTSTTTSSETSTSTPLVLNTYTSTPSSTLTETATSTATGTNSYTTTPTVTTSYTSTQTSTHTPTDTPIFTVTNTPTSTPSKGEPVVYPNPVTGPTTGVQIPIQTATRVSLKIFTLAFREVRTIDEGIVPVGVSLSVDLSDKQGVPLANGLYYFVIEAGPSKWVSKVLVLR